MLNILGPFYLSKAELSQSKLSWALKINVLATSSRRWIGSPKEQGAKYNAC